MMNDEPITLEDIAKITELITTAIDNPMTREQFWSALLDLSLRLSSREEA